MARVLLPFLFLYNFAYALDFKDLKIGMPVELTQNVFANKLKSGAALLCRDGQKAYYPKVELGPLEGADASVRYFKVVGLVTDPWGFEVKLQSDQMPCACVLSLMTWADYMGGDGSNFKVLIRADEKAMNQVPPIQSSCKNDPEWTKKLQMEEDGILEL